MKLTQLTTEMNPNQYVRKSQRNDGSYYCMGFIRAFEKYLIHFFVLIPSGKCFTKEQVDKGNIQKTAVGQRFRF